MVFLKTNPTKIISGKNFLGWSTVAINRQLSTWCSQINCCLGTQDGVLIPIYTDRDLWMLSSGKPNQWNVHDKSGLTEGLKCTKMSLLRKIGGVINDWIRWCLWSLLTSKLYIVISTSFLLDWTYVPFITFSFLFPLSVIFIFLFCWTLP